MESKDIFRTAILGGYQKEDVTDYIRSLENENEAIRILANKEKNDLKLQLEKEKSVSEGLKNSLAALHEKISVLEQKQQNNEMHSSVVSKPETEKNSQMEELKHQITEERKAILDDQKLWADNLTKNQLNMQNLWQNELQQLHRTLEMIQEQLKHTGRDASPARDLRQTQESEIRAEVETEAESEVETEVEPEAEPVTVSRESEPPQMGIASDDHSEEASTENHPEPEKQPVLEYIQKTSSSINQAQQRVSELLLKLDQF